MFVTCGPRTVNQEARQWCSYVGFPVPVRGGPSFPVGGVISEFQSSASVSAVAAPFKEGENRWA